MSMISLRQGKWAASVWRGFAVCGPVARGACARGRVMNHYCITPLNSNSHSASFCFEMFVFLHGFQKLCNLISSPRKRTQLKRFHACIISDTWVHNGDCKITLTCKSSRLIVEINVSQYTYVLYNVICNDELITNNIDKLFFQVIPHITR